MSGEYIYYTITSRSLNTDLCRIKFGKTSNKISRQKAHFTSAPHLIMHTYQVNDSHEAEKELHRLAKLDNKQLRCGDRVDTTIIRERPQFDEHYQMTEDEAKKFCEKVQEKFPKDKILDEGRISCIGCDHVISEMTVKKYDGLRCKRCWEKINDLVKNDYYQYKNKDNKNKNKNNKDKNSKNNKDNKNKDEDYELEYSDYESESISDTEMLDEDDMYVIRQLL